MIQEINLIDPSLIEGCKCEDVDIIKEDPKEFVAYFNKLADFISKKKGIGLATCQIGDFRKIAVMVDGDQVVPIINPRYFSNASRAQFKEGCLSYPRRSFLVKRFKSIKVNFISIKQKEDESYEFVEIKNKTLRGMQSIIFQHETDHCNGVSCAVKGKELRG